MASAPEITAQLPVMTPAVRQMARRYAGSLYSASAFLPQAKRNAVWGVLAFCGMIEEAMGPRPGDEAAGGCCDEGDPRLALLGRRLEEMRQARLELPQARFRGAEQQALAAAGAAVRRFEIPHKYFLDLAAVTGTTVRRYATWRTIAGRAAGRWPSS
jgi:phytoene/squalene synthetase